MQILNILKKIEAEYPQLLSTIQPISIKENILNIRPVQLADENSICFVSNEGDFSLAIQKHIPIIVRWNKKNYSPITASTSYVFETSNIQKLMTITLPFFDKKIARYKFTAGKINSIHPSAKIGKNVIIGDFTIVGENAVIADNCKIANNCTIGDNTIIKENTIILSNTTVEANCIIGNDSILHAQTYIGTLCQVGNYCEIHPHATIGSDGYGYSTDSSYKHTKIPQIGKVIIQDYVEIGSNCSIDRGTLVDTVIGMGTKIDNLCHIAHNCQIGSDCLLTAGFFTAGSSKFGNRFTCGGTTSVGDHVTICDGVTVAGRSVILRDIKVPGQYGGHPLQPMREYLKTLVNIASLEKFRKKS